MKEKFEYNLYTFEPRWFKTRFQVTAESAEQADAMIEDLFKNGKLDPFDLDDHAEYENFDYFEAPIQIPSGTVTEEIYAIHHEGHKPLATKKQT